MLKENGCLKMRILIRGTEQAVATARFNGRKVEMNDREKCLKPEWQTKQESISGDEFEKQTLFRVCLCSVRVTIGAWLAISFLSKDLVFIVLVGILHSVTGTVWSLVRFTIDSEKQLARTFVQAVLRGVEDLLGTLFCIICQVLDNGCDIVMHRLYQLIGLLGYSFILLVFAVAFIVRRILSFLFLDW